MQIGGVVAREPAGSASDERSPPAAAGVSWLPSWTAAPSASLQPDAASSNPPSGALTYQASSPQGAKTWAACWSGQPPDACAAAGAATIRARATRAPAPDRPRIPKG